MPGIRRILHPGLDIAMMGGKAATRTQRLQSLFGANFLGYYPLDDVAGLVAKDGSINVRDGAYVGSPALATVPAFGTVAPYFDGVDDEVDLPASVCAAFGKAEGTVIICIKLATVDWTDGTLANYFTAVTDGGNLVQFYKSAPNQLAFLILSGGGGGGATINDMTTENWLTFALTWSTVNNRILGYINGSRFMPVNAMSPAWVGAVAHATIGCWRGVAPYIAKGAFSNLILLDREATENEIRKVSAILGADRILSIIGDSIPSKDDTTWPYRVGIDYNGGNKITIKNHAASGNTIMANLDTQVAAAAGDNANIIVLTLGTGDDNAGDMVALQAKVASGIAALKLSNPAASIYYLNVLPRWTDSGGGTPVDKSNVRTAIAAACTAQGVTCWDPFSTPWITAAQTADGIHPIYAGHASIATHILARL